MIRTILTTLIILFIGTGQNAHSQQQPLPAVTSFVIGGVELQEDVKNPPVPSGMQKFEITYNTPTTGYGAGVELHAYPFEFAMLFYTVLRTPGAVTISEDRMTMTGMVDLPTGVTYQTLFSRSESDPHNEQQQYFWGTLELPDAVISGTAILPEGFTPLFGRSAGVAIIDPERYLKALESEYDFDLFQLAIVRITGFNEQLEFELKHVPDGDYAIIAFQRVLDAQGNREIMGTLLGINVLTGGVDPTELVQIVDDRSVTDLQISLVGEAGVVNLSEVRIDSVDAEPLFSVQPHRRPRMIVDASQAMIVNISKHIQDIFPLYLSGNVDDFLSFSIPFSDLTKGDIVSIYGTPVSETTIQATLVVRHAKRSDFDRDGDIDFDDFLFFVGVFGTRDIFPGYIFETDLDGDGRVSFPDFLIFVSDFGG